VTKIAPRLTNGFFVWPNAAVVKFSGKPMVKGAQRELRALLAVARAARREVEDIQGQDGDPYGICRAIARLDSASGRKR